MMLLNLAIAYAIGWVVGRLRIGGSVVWLVRELAWLAVAIFVLLATILLVPPELPIFALVILGGLVAIAGFLIWGRRSRRRRN